MDAVHHTCLSGCCPLAFPVSSERWLNGKRLITVQALLALAEVAEVADGDLARMLAMLDRVPRGFP